MNSSATPRYSETAMSSSRIVNGTPVMMATCCTASRPPASRSTKAKNATKTPQMTFIFADGFMSPLLDSMARTKAAESAEVMKNEPMSRIATSETTVLIGNCSKVMNRAVLMFSATAAPMFPPWKISRLIAAPPSTENHRKHRTLGTMSTPATNSRIVRPLEMRAMNVPTHMTHIIHQAQ